MQLKTFMQIFTDYRQYLKQEYDRRSEKNPSYSLRAFSAHLGLKPSRLSDVLNKKQGISESIALDIAKRIDLDSKHTQIFVLMVKSEHSRSKLAKEQAKLALKQLLQEPQNEFDNKMLSSISDWCYLPILALLTKMIGQKILLEEVATQLGVAIREVEQAIETFRKIGFVVLDGDQNLKKVVNHFHTSSVEKDENILKYQNRAFTKIAEACMAMENSRKEASTGFFLLDPADLPHLKNEIISSMQNILSRYHKPQLEKSEVFQISLGLIPYNNRS